jgi:uncharacterized protein YukE
MKKIIKKLVGLAAFVLMLFPFPAMADTYSDYQTQVNNLMQQIQSLQNQINQIQNGGNGSWCYSFNNNFGIGNSNNDTAQLVTALSREGLTMPSNSTPNSFSEGTASVVSAFQEKYRGEILTPFNFSAGTGYVGDRTRAKLNSLYGCNGNVIITPPTTSYLSVSNLQPSSGLVGAQVTIVGSGFTQTGNKVRFGNTNSEQNPSYNLNSYDGRTITFTVPSSNYFACLYSYPSCYIAQVLVQAGTYPVSVTNANGTSNSVNFTINQYGTQNNNMLPTVSYIYPTSGPRGTEVTVVGANFAPNDSIKFSDYGTYISNNYIDSTMLRFTAPSSLSNCNIQGTGCTNISYPNVTNGNYNIRVANGNGTSNSVTFTVTGY